MSNEPHFSNHVKQVSGEVGFGFVDLAELLAPYAANELIYNRDDTHWNERGHELVAQLLAQQVFGISAPQ
jgi:hypothetical protein